MRVNMSMCKRIRMRMHVCAYVYVYVYAYAYVYVCVCTCVCMQCMPINNENTGAPIVLRSLKGFSWWERVGTAVETEHRSSQARNTEDAALPHHIW